MTPSAITIQPCNTSSPGRYELHVGGIPNGVGTQTLCKKLSSFGSIEVEWIRKASNRKARFFALVRCADAITRDRILKSSDTLAIKGCPLRVQLCVPSKLVKTSKCQSTQNSRMSSPQPKNTALGTRDENSSVLGSHVRTKTKAVVDTGPLDKENRRKSFRMAATAAALAMASSDLASKQTVTPKSKPIAAHIQGYPPPVKIAPFPAQRGADHHKLQLHVKKARETAKTVSTMVEMPAVEHNSAKPSLRVRSQRRLSALASALGTVVQYACRDKKPGADGDPDHACASKKDGQKHQPTRNLSRPLPNSDVSSLPEEFHTANGDTLPTLSVCNRSAYSNLGPHDSFDVHALTDFSIQSDMRNVSAQKNPTPSSLASSGLQRAIGLNDFSLGTETQTSPNYRKGYARLSAGGSQHNTNSNMGKDLFPSLGREFVDIDPDSTQSEATWGVPASPGTSHHREFLRITGIDLMRGGSCQKTEFLSGTNGRPKVNNFESCPNSEIWPSTKEALSYITEDGLHDQQMQLSRSFIQGPKARILVIHAPAIADLSKVRELVAQHGSIETWDLVWTEGAFRIYATMSSPEQAYLASIQLRDSLPKVSKSYASLG